MIKETEFDQNEFELAYPDGIENNYWNVARNKVIHHFISKYKLSNILDVGCGRGVVTAYLHNKKINIVGVELGNTTPVSNSNVFIRYKTDARLLPETERAEFKTIALFDVIEHIENPVTFLKDLCSSLPNVDRLIFTVPARREIWTNFDDFYCHFRRYDMDMAKKQIIESGFKIIDMRYFFHTLYSVILLNNTFFKRREIKFNPPPKGIIASINKFVGYLMYLETFLLPNFFRGSSLIVVAEKI